MIIRGSRGSGDLRRERSVGIGREAITEELRAGSDTQTEKNTRNETIEERFDELRVIGREVILSVERAENDTQKHSKEKAHSKDDVKLDAAGKRRMDSEGTRAAEVANSQVDELSESEGQSKRKRHSNESKAVKWGMIQ